MYGLIGEIKAVEGGREELAGILAGIGDMPGCLSYMVSLDASDQRRSGRPRFGSAPTTTRPP